MSNIVSIHEMTPWNKYTFRIAGALCVLQGFGSFFLLA